MNDRLDPLDKTLAHLHTSVRLANILDNACLKRPAFADKVGLPSPHTLRDLIQWSESDLLRLPHFGMRTLDELRKLLLQEGLSLRDPLARPCARRSCSKLASSNTKYCPEHRCSRPGCPEPRVGDHPTCKAHIPVHPRLQATQAIIGLLNHLSYEDQRRTLEAATIILGHGPFTAATRALVADTARRLDRDVDEWLALCEEKGWDPTRIPPELEARTPSTTKPRSKKTSKSRTSRKRSKKKKKTSKKAR